MRSLSIRAGAAGLLLSAAAAALSCSCHALDESAAVQARFADPPREFASGPLWVWNDDLTETQIRETLRDLAGQHVRQAFVHPRPGLMTPYLSEDWFRLWKVALDEAAKLDMNIWIYDENSYPSGFAGGWVPELMPESRGMGLVQREVKSVRAWEESFVAVHRLDGDQAEDVSARVKAGENLPEGRYSIAEIRRAGNSPWTGNRSYVNLISKGVTQKFLEVTHEAYQREIGDQFGKRVPGSFTDEPQLRPAGGMPWCPDLPEEFEKRWGYTLIKTLPSLTLEVGEWQRVRHNYFSTLNELFIERWAKPYSEWCEENHLMFTGHYWDHEWPNCVGVPDNMAMASWQQAPGIDCLMNQYAEHTHAQFGNIRFVRELASVANQFGRERRLCEIYGAGGWDLRFVDMKRIADWLGVLGVNLFDEHLSYITIRGARKRDHPQSFSYHEPWWQDYHVMADYLTRLSVAMSAGEQVNHIVVIEPTTTAWMYQGNGAKLGDVGSRFFKFLQLLEAAQIDYDLVSEYVLATHGAVLNQDGRKAGLRVGQRDYPVLIIPPGTENLDRQTVQLIEEATPGLVVWCIGEPPSRIAGAPSDRCAQLAAKFSTWRSIDEVRDMAWLRGTMPFDGLRVDRAPGDAGILFHQRRRLADGDLLLLVNTSLEAPSRGEVFTTRKEIESWDLFTGKVEPWPVEANDSGATAKFDLPPAGSLLLHLRPESRSGTLASAEVPVGERQFAATAATPVKVTRLGPNVLTLDYVDVKAGNQSRESVYFYDANRLVWQQHGLERNPWDSAVQFKDELISRSFPAGSGFTVSYRFVIEGAVPANLAIVIERPDLYTITCNGKPVQSKPGDWWLDKAFGRIAIADAAKEGANTVTLTAHPFTMSHEVESAYVTGDFSLEPREHGFVIVPPRPLEITPAEPVQVHAINPDGTMWLSGGIGYTRNADGTAVEDRNPFVVFDLGKPVDLSGIRVWNYCEGHVRDLTSRGVKELRVQVIPEGAQGSESVDKGVFTLARPQGPASPETLEVNATKTHRVILEMVSNQNGVRYPVTGDAPDNDNGFVGLAEVQFLDAAGEVVKGVRIDRLSGELASHQRTANHLLDGSGLMTERPGWKEQGLPFYASAVAYQQEFNVADATGRFYVRLPEWLGSVARVRVNDKPAGRIVSPPWQCEVTEQIVAGKNTIVVEVVGTLKNTLGPHHGNPGLGSAWPGMFQHGPNPGPPPGNEYSLVSYGLFEPFLLEQR